MASDPCPDGRARCTEVSRRRPCTARPTPNAASSKRAWWLGPGSRRPRRRSQPCPTSIEATCPSGARHSRGSSTGRSPDRSRTGTSSAIPTPPDGAPNVLLVLIDDAGFGNPSTFGGPIQTPELHPDGRGRRPLQPLPRHGHLLADAGGAADRPQQPCRRLRLGRRVRRRLPGLLRHAAPRLRAAAADPARQRLQHGRLRQVAPDPRRAAGSGRTVRPLAHRLGLRVLLRLPRRRRRPVGHGPRREPEDHRRRSRATATRPIRTTCRTRWRTRPSSGSTGSGRRTRKKPFFAYFSTGCSHAPHHVAESWAAKYKGKFDQGWDRLREETFARQKALGVVPPEAELTPRNEAFPAWDDVPDKLKPFYARQMEVYAGFSENADHNVGRVIDAIDELGELDNTLVIWIWGDNGASMEGTVTGSFNELTMQNGIPLTDEMQLQLSERYGGHGGLGRRDHGARTTGRPGRGPATRPFQWGKQVGSHLGGTRNPMVIHWPDRVAVGGRAPVAVHARHRHRADHPRHRRHPGAGVGRRHRPATAPRGRLHGQPDGGGRAGAAHAAVLRVGRQPGHVQGRLVARRCGRRASRGSSRRRRSRPTRRASGTPTPIRPSSTTCPTTSARRTTWRRSTRRRWPSSGSSSGRRPSATRSCRSWPPCRRSSASCRRCPRPPSSSSGATSRTSSPG